LSWFTNLQRKSSTSVQKPRTDFKVSPRKNQSLLLKLENTLWAFWFFLPAHDKQIP